MCVYSAQKVAVHKVIGYLLQESGSQCADKTIENKAFAAPNVLKRVAKHPNGKHIKKQMRKASVKETIGYPLPDVVIGSGKEVKPEPIGQIDASRTQNNGCKIAYSVYD
jgi:hypothetical protein